MVGIIRNRRHHDTIRLSGLLLILYLTLPAVAATKAALDHFITNGNNQSDSSVHSSGDNGANERQQHHRPLSYERPYNQSNKQMANSNLFVLDCNHHLIESNYFRQSNESISLVPGAQLHYRCSLLLDVRNCPSGVDDAHQSDTEATAVTIAPQCHDVRIEVQVPHSLQTKPELFYENATKVFHNSGYEQYHVWLNITNFTASVHQGIYRFVFSTNQPIFHHALILKAVTGQSDNHTYTLDAVIQPVTEVMFASLSGYMLLLILLSCAVVLALTTIISAVLFKPILLSFRLNI